MNVQVFSQLESWRAFRQGLKGSTTIGFVPTLGFLHEGHASLLRRARQENDLVVLSVFVNPAQFNDQGDYAAYPRNLKRDLLLAKQCEVDCVLAPDEGLARPDKGCFVATHDPFFDLFEGSSRPGHFTAVLTVVAQFLNLVQPTKTYFGEKDYQQYVLIRSLVRDLCMPVDVVLCPTVRSKDGLPLSSRNSRLTKEETQLATSAFRLLKGITPHTAGSVRTELQKLVTLDYLEIHDDRLFVAFYVGTVRLIDSLSLTSPKMF